jgi:biotin carboxyl carrier protein
MSRRVEVRHAGTTYSVEILGGGAVRVDGQLLQVDALGDARCLVTREDGTHAVVAHAGTTAAPWLFAMGQAGQVDVVPDGARPRSSAAASDDMTAPMPATVVSIAAAPGTRVVAGDPVVVLEAMKMELVVRAPRDGDVSAVHCRVGELVQPGTLLAELAS